MKILYGELYEIKKSNNKFTELVYEKDNITYMHNKFGEHMVSNITKKPSISLHIYSPPNFYD